MPRLRLVAGLVAAAAVGGAACDTSAVGIEECRTIEQERCSAARGCDDGITTDALQTECDLFSRDNCLHGLPVAAPKPSVLDACVKAIHAAGVCAAGKPGPKALAEKCSGVGTVSPTSLTVCDIVENPEQAHACDFLNQTPTPAATSTVDAGHD